MGRSFRVEYGPGSFSVQRDGETVREWETLDGGCVIVATVPADKMGTGEVRDRDPGSRECEGDSLREIWEAFAAGVQFGTVRADGRKLGQLAPMDAYTRKLLAAAESSIGPKERERERIRVA